MTSRLQGGVVVVVVVRGTLVQLLSLRAPPPGRGFILVCYSTSRKPCLKVSVFLARGLLLLKRCLSHVSSLCGGVGGGGLLRGLHGVSVSAFFGFYCSFLILVKKLLLKINPGLLEEEEEEECVCLHV